MGAVPDTPDTRTNFGARAVRSAAAAFTSQGLSFTINFGVAIGLARLLTPEDFGLFGIAFAVTGFLEFAKDGGMVVPLIQAESLTAEQLDTLFWFNAGVGFVITVVAVGIAPLVGHAYADARITPIICVLALVFLWGGLATQHVALLRRQMRFATLARCEIAALLIGACVAVVTALEGAGYWSLVCFQLVREFVLTVLVFAATGWRPSRPREWHAIGALVRFGGLMMVFDLIGYLNYKVDNLIVGWFLGPAALGFYDKAYQLLLMPVNQINVPLSNVVHATLSRLQREPERYRAYLSRALLLGTALGLPLIAFCYANAHAIMSQLLGHQWLPSVPVFRALAPAAVCMTITASMGWIFLSLGRAGRQLPWAVFTTTITVIAFIVGTHWGVVGVALAFSISRVALLLPTLMFTCAGTLVRWTELLAAAAPPAFATAVAFAASLSLNAVVPLSVWTLPLNVAVFGAMYVLGWMIVPGGRELVGENLMRARALYQNT
jgi:O-antigen/teichoic acid export membrane protein